MSRVNILKAHVVHIKEHGEIVKFWLHPDSHDVTKVI